MGKKRREQVTGKTYEERIKLAEKSGIFSLYKARKKWHNIRKGLANNSRGK